MTISNDSSLDARAPRLFVGGTGRSGTTIVYRALGSHSQIHAFPSELRFLIDSGGLLDVIDALTVRYDPIAACEVVYGFERMLKTYMTIPERRPYYGHDLRAWLGPERFDSAVAEFFETIEIARFQGSSAAVSSDYEGLLVAVAHTLQRWRRRITGQSTAPSRPRLARPELSVVRYFGERQDAVAVARRFVDGLFLGAARENGKAGWCEKSAQSLFHVDRLFEVFPDSVFIHVKRDPRGVVQSLVNQSWAPNNVRDAARFVRQMYDRWADLRRSMELDERRFVEVRLEDIAAGGSSALDELAARCGLEGNFLSPPEIIPERVEYWRDEMTAEDQQIVVDELGSQFGVMGYQQ